MSSFCDKRLATGRTRAGLWVYASSCLLSLVLSHQASAAGCGHHSQPAFGDDFDRIIVIYEGGIFYYYDNLQPCSGPSCGHSLPSSMDSAPAVVCQERTNMVTPPNACWDFQLRPTALRLLLETSYLSPSYDEPLRPPVAI